ncbi:hypothetical protein H012_gp328 [Acanthamoeba polyphaga moumouvirus]|uniref:Uncharacterized protein n=2 Tax=Moumouvirus TaxID=3080801 RepID=L7RCU8_9VIRU|nr:hypothetical protein H012_gp328 [Acanthamoeba polyphaga moumouvirus]AEX62553.1 hypothetical protein mv_L348 [Moumouvirus Monve]AGC02127.1 hypothetical protein Moumou_00601 [Acanthamoeba polyphaga moumouvirus]
MNSTQTVTCEPTNEKEVFEDTPETVTEPETKKDDSPYSPQAGATRLALLPKNVYDEFRRVSYGQAFGVFLERLERDSKSDVFEHYHSLWLRIVNNLCVSFAKKNFYSREPEVTFSEEFRKCLNQTDVLDVIQTFIDFAQQDGKTDDFREASYYRRLYKSFVRLYHQCNGSWGFSEQRTVRRSFTGSRYNSKSSSRNNAYTGQQGRMNRSRSHFTTRQNRTSESDNGNDSDTRPDRVTQRYRKPAGSRPAKRAYVVKSGQRSLAN